MAKSKSERTVKSGFEVVKTQPKTAIVDNGRMTPQDNGGVVAYTEGSRFKDAEVLAVVERILSKS